MTYINKSKWRDVYVYIYIYIYIRSVGLWELLVIPYLARHLQPMTPSRVQGRNRHRIRRIPESWSMTIARPQQAQETGESGILPPAYMLQLFLESILSNLLESQGQGSMLDLVCWNMSYALETCELRCHTYQDLIES